MPVVWPRCQHCPVLLCPPENKGLHLYHGLQGFPSPSSLGEGREGVLCHIMGRVRFSLNPRDQRTFLSPECSVCFNLYQSQAPKLVYKHFLETPFVSSSRGLVHPQSSPAHDVTVKTARKVLKILRQEKEARERGRGSAAFQGKCAAPKCAWLCAMDGRL